MSYPRPADNQAVSARFGGEAIWLTDLITPDNPEVMLLFKKLTEGLNTTEDKVIACWRYVAAIPYRETIRARLTVQGKSYCESDTWLYPGEMIRLSPVGNCSNKSFLLTSLLRNELPESSVRCALGHISLDGIGAHAWVTLMLSGQDYILESTVSQMEKALLPLERADAYSPVILFNDQGVYVVSEGDILNEHFGFCAIEWLHEYVCGRCEVLTPP
jgi:hypothetical protein